MLRRTRDLGIVLIACCAVWWGFALLYTPYISTPRAVLAVLFSPEAQELLYPTIITIIAVSLSLAVSLVAGYLLGCAMGLSTTVRTWLYFPTSVFKSVPVTVFLPVFMTVFGLSFFTYPMLCLPICAMVAVNIANTIGEMPRSRLLQRRLLRLSIGVYIRDIVFWETLGSFFATVRIAAPFCLTIQVALDYFLDANGGLGSFIKNRYEAYQYAPMYLAILLVCAIGFLLLFSVDILSRKLQRWKTKGSN